MINIFSANELSRQKEKQEKEKKGPLSMGVDYTGGIRVGRMNKSNR